MSERRYRNAIAEGQTAAEALHGYLHPGGTPAVDAGRVERFAGTLFAVLTESQQERVLQALGWSPIPSPLPRPPDDGTEPTAAVHDPEPRPRARACAIQCQAAGPNHAPCALGQCIAAPEPACIVNCWRHLCARRMGFGIDLPHGEACDACGATR